MPRKKYASDLKWNARRRKSSAATVSDPQRIATPASSRTRRNQSRRARAAPPRAAPASPELAATDYGAFTRTRGARAAAPSSPALPELAELAAQEAPELGDVAGGVCGCGEPHTDDARHCGKCGRALRHECPRCRRAMARGQSFCAECGTEAPAPSSPSSPSSPAPVEPSAQWDADDMFWASSIMDYLLVHWDAEIMEAKPRARLHEKTATVMNKHFRIGGKWKDEIALSMVIAGTLWGPAYHHYVIAPRMKRRELMRAKKTESPSEAK